MFLIGKTVLIEMILHSVHLINKPLLLIITPVVQEASAAISLNPALFIAATWHYFKLFVYDV